MKGPQGQKKRAERRRLIGWANRFIMKIGRLFSVA
jgi:hypothetical protein